MTTAIWVLGYFFAVVIGVAVMASVVSFAAWQVRWTIGRIRQDGADLERRELGAALVSASWWFSEDKVTMDLLCAIAADLSRGLDPAARVSENREQWRKQRRQPLEMRA